MISKVQLIMPNFNWNAEFDIQKDPPVGLLYIAAVLLKNEYTVEITDANAENLSVDGVLERIEAFGPDLVGISANFSPLHNSALLLSKRIKAFDSSICVVVGGNHATACADYMLEESRGCIDYIARGQGETVLTNLINGLNGGLKQDHIRGISYLRNGKVVSNKPEALIDDLDGLPFPAYHLLNMSLYNRYNLITSRGCPFRCNYCASNVICNRVRYRSPDKIIEEIEYLITNFGNKHFWFSDDTFTANFKHTDELLDKMIEGHLNISWSCLTRVNRTKRGLLDEMKRAGCKYISYGVESGDQLMLDRMNKRITLDEVREALIMTKEAGIDMYAFFLIGYPGDTVTAVEQSFKLIQEVRPNGVSFAVVIPLPGTTLWRFLEDNNQIDYGSIEWDYLFAKTGKGQYENYPATLAAGWCDIPDDKLIELCRKGESLCPETD